MKNNILTNIFFDAELFAVSEPSEVLKNASGDNKKGLLVVYPQEDGTPNNRALLKKILGAAQFEVPQDILLLPLPPNKGFTVARLAKLQAVNHLISFGIPAPQLGLHVKHALYQPFTFRNCTYLFAGRLSAISADKHLKSALWACLKKVFLNK